MLSKEKENNLSKFVSYVLRHNPDEVGIKLDEQGWTNVDVLIKNSQSKHAFNLEDLKQVVSNNSKQRFVFSEDGQNIRAQQGHSVEVDLKLVNVKPPKELYHGTATRFLSFIKEEGLKPMNRHDVHLSFNQDVAEKVGERHGKVIVLVIDTEKMYQDGFDFQCTANNVWLTKTVPVNYIKNIND